MSNVPKKAPNFPNKVPNLPTRRKTAMFILTALYRISASNRHLHLDGLVRQVPLDLEVLVLEGVDVGFVRRVDGERGERARFPLQLLPEGVDVVDVDVRVANGVDELAGFQTTRLEGRAGWAKGEHSCNGKSHQDRGDTNSWAFALMLWRCNEHHVRWSWSSRISRKTQQLRSHVRHSNRMVERCVDVLTSQTG